MAMIYKGDGNAHINGVPARDLTDEEVKALATAWGVSLAECEGMLMKFKLYALAPKTVTKAAEKKEES